MKKRIKIFFVFFFVFFVFNGSYSQFMNEPSMKNLVEKSTHIIKGKVQNIGYFTKNNKKDFYTKVTIQIEEQIKGKWEKPTIEVHHEGGIINNIGCKVSDMPEFKKNEEVLLYCKQQPDNSFTICGDKFGKVNIKNGCELRSGKKISAVIKEITNFIK